MNVLEEIKTILGRDAEFKQVTFEGKQGYIPIYFDYLLRNSASTLFAKTIEESAEQFLEHLKKKQGDTNEVGTGDQPKDSQEDSGPVSTDG